ncbi:hypothetical protein FB45DRAFT_895123 [Roridomyces roridus]|uniref:BTB domain-containing protein n=1 Tax=Roridomyces roridus TaxID=1738132 RepID=A0AAD7CGV6_9AGAR|nr:hypothetical protein FB45DRAFT_895123 [Roridomyces roridus]
MSDLDTAARPFAPTAPFDDSSADVILRSSDAVNFHVYRVILSVASPFFKQMFMLPQPSSEPDIPIIDVSESALVLNSALRFWYPGAEPATEETVDVLRETLEVLILKYDMQFLVPAAKKCLRGRLDRDAIAVFAIACRLRWKDMAVDAAQATLKLPIRAFESPQLDQLDCIGAKDYHSLLYYHAECGKAATAATSSLEWYHFIRVGSPGGDCNTSPDICPYADGGEWKFAQSETRQVMKWFADHLAELTTIIGRTPGAKLDSPELLLKVHQGSQICPDCRKSGLARVVKFSAVLEAHIQKKLDSIKLNLDF